MHEAAPSLVTNCISSAEKLELRYRYMQNYALRSDYENFSEFVNFGVFVVARAMIKMKE